MNINIADAELPIMKVLWQRDNLTSPEIFREMDANVSTLKTLLGRLVSKGAVRATQASTRTYTYSANVTRAEYTKQQTSGFVNRVFDGSHEKMLLNFVKEENVTKEDLRRLLDIIEED